MAGQFGIYTGTINGAAGSLLTVLDAILVTGAGWTKPLTGANKTAYLSAGTVPAYLRVDDSGPGAAGALEARITGYETMSDVDTGTYPFPTTALGLGATVAAYCVRKTSAAGTSRAYIAFADAGTIYFFCQSEGTFYAAFAFGEFDSLKSGDSYRNLCVGRKAENSTAGSNDCLDQINAYFSGSSLDTGYGALDRIYTGAGAAVGLRRGPDGSWGGGSGVLGVGTMPYPNAPDGKIYIAQVRVVETSQVYRGTLRGFWGSCHPVASFNDGDTFSGTGTLTGKTFRFVKSSGNSGLYCIETSATLSTP